MNKKIQYDLAPPDAVAAERLEFLCWDEERMATGVAALDRGSQELIRKLNELYYAHRAGLKVSDIYQMLKFIAAHIKTHFKHEEKVMEERQCPVRWENRRAHAEFLGRFQDLVVNFTLEMDTDQAATHIENTLARWLSPHICRVDVALRDCPPRPAPPPKTD